MKPYPPFTIARQITFPHSSNGCINLSLPLINKKSLNTLDLIDKRIGAELGKLAVVADAGIRPVVGLKSWTKTIGANALDLITIAGRYGGGWGWYVIGVLEPHGGYSTRTIFYCFFSKIPTRNIRSLNGRRECE